MTKKEFSARVRELRDRRGMTQEQLAEASGLSADTIRRLEKALFNPSLETMNKLAKGLGITVFDLMADRLDESDDLAAMFRSLPERERHLASVMLGTLTVYSLTH
ncbi:MAG: helix-turn-helix transcriptional regulator [Myxococcales bacterium]|nr:helix-turn-helix transcriptional regulator [Myxococcales bacterium]